MNCAELIFAVAVIGILASGLAVIIFEVAHLAVRHVAGHGGLGKCIYAFGAAVRRICGHRQFR